LSHVAACHCGAVTVTVAEGVPLAIVNICHCLACQRRTGSPFGSIVWVPEATATVAGETRADTRPTDEGRQFTSHFCVICGSNIAFNAEKNPGLRGIAGGAFADPALPPPRASVWEESRHPWVAVPEGAARYPRGRG
jgi:hypothetical protein